MNYKQSVYSILLKYTNAKYIYEVNSFSGEREEDGANTYIKVCNSVFEDIGLDVTPSFMLILKKAMEQINVELYRKNIDFSALMDLHNEIVVIDNKKRSNRSYGFLRLCFKKDNNMHLEDIAIFSKNSNELVDKMNFFAKNVIIGNLPNESKEIEFRSLPHILAPKAAGFFIHEIVGHSLEADHYHFNKEKYSKIKIPYKLTIVDSANGHEEIAGEKEYDDMGTVVKPLILVNKGNVQNILAIHKEDSFDKILYGTARRESYKHEVLPRMRNTYIKPYDHLNKIEIMSKYSKAIFVNEAFSGGMDYQTGDYFLLGNGYIVNNGILENFIGNLEIKGNLFNDIPLIEYIGNDLEMYGSYCIKINQSIRVGCGGPTISISTLNSRGTLYGRR